MASDITVSSLVASTGVGLAVLTGIASSPAGQSCLPYMQAVRVEFYVASSNNRAAATTYDGGLAGIAKVSLNGGTYYAWARAVDSEGNFGPYYPVSSTGGVSFVIDSASIDDGSITTQKLADGAVTPQKFTTGTTPVEYGAALPTSGNYVGRTYVLDSDEKLYRYGASGWTKAVATVDLTGTIISTQIADNAITANKILANSVTSVKILANAITTAKLAAGAVTATTIGANAVTADKIIAGAISTAKLAASAVTADKLSVTTLSAITADIGTVTAGILQGPTLQTGSSGARIVVGPSNAFIVYASNGSQIAKLGTQASALSPPLTVNSTGPAATFAASVVGSGTTFSNSGGGPVVVSTSTSTGSNAHAFRGSATSGGHGIVGVSNGGGGYAFFAETGTYAPFTGSHDGLIAKTHNLDIGDIVVDRRVIARDGINDTLTEVEPSTSTQQRGVVGVLSGRMTFLPASQISGLPGNIETPVKRYLSENYDRVSINSVGEGQMNVCGLGGDLSVGDFICASEIYGKGQRQNDSNGDPDDFVRRSTVAKVRENVIFDYPDHVKRVAVIYVCG